MQNKAPRSAQLLCRTPSPSPVGVFPAGLQLGGPWHGLTNFPSTSFGFSSALFSVLPWGKQRKGAALSLGLLCGPIERGSAEPRSPQVLRSPENTKPLQPGRTCSISCDMGHALQLRSQVCLDKHDCDGRGAWERMSVLLGSCCPLALPVPLAGTVQALCGAAGVFPCSCECRNGLCRNGLCRNGLCAACRDPARAGRSGHARLRVPGRVQDGAGSVRRRARLGTGLAACGDKAWVGACSFPYLFYLFAFRMGRNLELGNSSGERSKVSPGGRRLSSPTEPRPSARRSRACDGCSGLEMGSSPR